LMRWRKWKCVEVGGKRKEKKERKIKKIII